MGKKELITRNTYEIIDEEVLLSIAEKRPLSIYWGTAPTGVPHVGYFVPIFKIGDFLKAGCRVKILLADIHAYLDNMKSSWEELESRTQFYEFLIKEMLSLADIPLENLEFVKGSDFQLQQNYTLDMYKLSALTTLKYSQHAGAEVVKQTNNPKISGLLYPELQALDEEYLNVDVQFGGVDQRKIFMFARESLPKIGYNKRSYIINPLVPGLTQSGKMSSSEPNSKIDFFDTPKQIQKKISKAYSVDGESKGNGLLAILQYILFPYFEQQNITFTIERPEQYGGRIEFSNYNEVEAAFESQRLSSIDLKQAIGKELITFLEPLQKKLQENKTLYENAYQN